MNTDEKMLFDTQFKVVINTGEIVHCMWEFWQSLFTLTSHKMTCVR